MRSAICAKFASVTLGSMSKRTKTFSNSARISLLIVLVALAAGAGFWLKRSQITSPPRPPIYAPKVPAGMMAYIIFLPNAQAFLTRKIIMEKNPFPKPPTWEMKAGHTLELLCQRLKELPQNTKVLSFPKRGKDGVVTINLSEDFMKLQMQPDTAVALVLDAMASTLGTVASPNGKPVKMKVLVENQRVHGFSEFDLSEPWTSTQPQDETPPRTEDTV